MPKSNPETIRRCLDEAFELSQGALQKRDPEVKKRMRDEALRLYKKVLSLDKKNSSAAQGIGRIYLHEKRFKEAYTAYKKGLAVASPNKKYVFLNGLANVRRYEGDWNKAVRKSYEEAIDLYKKALKFATGPEKAICLSNLSVTYAELRMWKEAISANQKALAAIKKYKVHENMIKLLKMEQAVYREYDKFTL